jgi:nitrogen regulatory protein PII
MKQPGKGSQKKVTVENLVGLGAQRMAEILVGVAETRVDLKRRLRMELAAEQGPAALVAEVDKRLGSFETSRG